VVVFLKPHYWVLRDVLAGESGHALDWCFHFATAEVARDGTTNAVHTRLPNGRPNLAVIPLERDDLAVEIVRGGPSSPVGWLAVGYERKVQAASARFRTTSVLPCVLHTVLVPFRGDSPWARVTARPIESNAASTLNRAFEVSRPGSRDVWAFSDGTATRFHEGWSTDARTTCVQLNESGDVAGCVLISGSRVEIGGEPLITLDRAVRAATLSIVDGRRQIELSEPAKVVHCAFDHVVRKAG
jgi:hypothetical protein